MIEGLAKKYPLSTVSITTPHPLQSKVQAVALGIFMAGVFALVLGIYTSSPALKITACALYCATCLTYAFTLANFFSTTTSLAIRTYSSSAFAVLRNRLPHEMSPHAALNLNSIAQMTDLQRADLILRHSQMEYAPSETQVGFDMQRGVALLKEPRGEGAYKKVFAGVNLPTLDPVAHLIVNIPTSVSELRIQQEVYLQTLVQGPNIVEIFHVCHIPSAHEPQISILAEYCEMDLEKYIHHILPKLAPKTRVAKVLEILDGLFTALLKLEQAGIHHRDIKPANILLDLSQEKICAKVGDFGGATLIEQEKQFPECFYTIHYAAPEFLKAHRLIRIAKKALHEPDALDKQEKEELMHSLEEAKICRLELKLLIARCAEIAATTRGDVWSAGIILFWLAAGQRFCQLKKFETIEKRIRKIVQHDVEQRFSQIQLKNRKLKVLLSLSRYILQVDPKLRPSAKNCQKAFAKLKKKIELKWSQCKE